MIYGKSYNAAVRECPNCTRLSNVHTDCDRCGTRICEDCAIFAGGNRYCSVRCQQDACEHTNLVCSETESHDYQTNYHDLCITARCADCGASFDEYELTERKAA